MRFHHSKYSIVSLAALATACLPFQAQAEAIYDAQAAVTLSLVSATGPAGDFTAFAFAQVLNSGITSIDDTSGGTGSGIAPNPEATLADNPLFLSAGAFGGASGIGTASSFVFTEGTITLDNTSVLETAEFNFQLDYSASAIATVDDPILEVASASAFITVDDGTSLIVDEALEVDTENALSASPVMQSLMFSVSVAPLSNLEILVLVDAEGTLVSERVAPPPPPPPPPPPGVPEPASALLLGIGLSALGFRRRARR